MMTHVFDVYSRRVVNRLVATNLRERSDRAADARNNQVGALLQGHTYPAILQ